MIAPSLIAMALFGLSQPSTVQTRTVHLRPWTIAIRSDRFTGVATCTAMTRGVHVKDGLAVFELGSTVDTSNALYRLDLGPARLARGADIAERTAYDSGRTDNLGNPSSGRVVLPIALLNGVRRVDIRGEDPHHVATFDVSALAKALAAETAAGCQPDWQSSPAPSQTAAAELK